MEWSMTYERRSIPGWENQYAADTEGRIWDVHSVSVEEHHPLGVWTHKKGYPLVKLFTEEGVGKRYTVHKLVCRAFHGEPPQGMRVVRHQHDQRQNSRPENLSWGTYSDNAKDAYRNGRMPRGEDHFNAVLTEVLVIALRQAGFAGETPNQPSAERGTGI